MDKLLEPTVVIRFSAVQYCCAKKCPDVYRNRWTDRPKFLPVNCGTRLFPWNSLDKNRTAPQTQKICELVVYLGSIKCSISWVQLPSHSKLIETSFQLLNKSMTKLYDLLILAHQHQNENSTHCSLYMSYATNKENLLKRSKDSLLAEQSLLGKFFMQRFNTVHDMHRSLYLFMFSETYYRQIPKRRFFSPCHERGTEKKLESSWRIESQTLRLHFAFKRE